MLSTMLSCNWEKKKKKDTNQPLFLNVYDFNNPDQIIELPKELEEVSGIGIVNDSVFAAISDERPFLYFLNWKQQTIAEKIKINKGYDFEDLCIKGDTIYVLQSNGVLWNVANYTTNPAITSIDLRIVQPFELEGMCGGGTKDSIFIAAKYWHQTEGSKKSELPVWTFNVGINRLTDSPLFFIDSKVEIDSKKQTFHTSGMARITNLNYWLAISTNDKYIAALNNKGEIKDFAALNPQIFTQPEGIVVDDKEAIYISNEDKNGTATILKFNKRKR
jgi:hypothetical protein